MGLHRWFLPHRETHKKTPLLSVEAFGVYIVLFLALQLSFKVINLVYPGVLGISSSIEKQEVIRLTNVERSRLGLGSVGENQSLDQAALAKARNMFEENYWAHFSPSGKDPWGFMLSSGYRFSFAGENLAKNFQDSQSVVTAWMQSPSHRENIINGKYKDIGVAVIDGTLNGQQTTLVVQMFGTTDSLSTASRSSPHLVQSAQIEQSQPSPKVLINPYQVSKSFGLGLIGLISLLLIVDFLILRRRGVFRISSHHLAHMAILGTAAAALLTASPGSIL